MNRTWTGAAFILCAALLGGASTLFPVEDGAEGLTAPVLALGRNLLQLALFSRLSTLHFSLNFPVIPLLLSAALYLLCRCVQRGRELQEDNDSII